MTGMLAELCRGAEEDLCHHVISNVINFKRLLEEMVATSSTYWYNKNLHRCEGTMY